MKAPAPSPPSGESRLNARITPRKKTTLLTALLLCVCTLSLLKGFARQVSTPRRDRCKPVKVTVRGTLTRPPVRGTGTASPLTMRFQFAEIPFDAERSESEINLQKNGDFECTFDILSTRVPTAFSLVVEQAGCETRTIRHLTLSGDPLSCTIPHILLTPPRPEESL